MEAKKVKSSRAKSELSWTQNQTKLSSKMRFHLVADFPPSKERESSNYDSNSI